MTLKMLLQIRNRDLLKREDSLMLLANKTTMKNPLSHLMGKKVIAILTKKNQKTCNKIKKRKSQMIMYRIKMNPKLKNKTKDRIRHLIKT